MPKPVGGTVHTVDHPGSGGTGTWNPAPSPRLIAVIGQESLGNTGTPCEVVGSRLMGSPLPERPVQKRRYKWQGLPMPRHAWLRGTVCGGSSARLSAACRGHRSATRLRNWRGNCDSARSRGGRGEAAEAEACTRKARSDWCSAEKSKRNCCRPPRSGVPHRVERPFQKSAGVEMF